MRRNTFHGSPRALSVGVFLLSASLFAQAGSKIAPGPSGELRAEADRIVREVLTSTGVPSASIAIVQGGQIVYVQAYGDARLEPPTPARRDPDARGTAQAFARRPGLQIPSRLDARERGHGPAAPVAHLGLSGLLASGLRASLHDPRGDGRGDPEPLGQEAARFRSGDRVAIQQHRLCHRGGHCRKGIRRASVGAPPVSRLHSARDGERH